MPTLEYDPAMLRYATCVSTLLCVACETVPEAPRGIALLRISETAGACAFERDNDGVLELPLDLPFERARAVASFRESARWPGGHAVTVGWKQADGTLGRLQVDVPPERGYGIAFVGDAVWPQAVGFEQWKDGARTFAPTGVDGVVNYRPQEEPPPDLLGRATSWDGPTRPPERLYVHMGFTGTDPGGNTVCRIVGLHAVTYRDRQEPYDPAWLEAEPSMQFVSASGHVTPPTYASTRAPTADLVLPLDAPPDPGSPPPWIEVKAPLALSRGHGDGSGACD